MVGCLLCAVGLFGVIRFLVVLGVLCLHIVVIGLVVSLCLDLRFVLLLWLVVGDLG